MNVGKDYDDKDIQLLERYFGSRFSPSTTSAESTTETTKSTVSPTETKVVEETPRETKPTTTISGEKNYFIPVVAISVVIIVLVLLVTTRK